MSMDYQQLVETMTRDTYQRMQRALELGKWPNGELLTPEQRENTMQAVILWGERHLPAEERIGFIKKKKKAEDVFDAPLNWKD